MRIPIRLKLAGALAVPLLALVGVAGYEVERANGRAAEVASEVALSEAAIGPGSLIRTLQDERNFSGAELLGLVGQLNPPLSSYEEGRAAVDEARASLQRFVAVEGEEVEAVFRAGLRQIDSQLEDLRSDVSSSTHARDLSNGVFAGEVFARYTAIIRTLIDSTIDIAVEIDDADLRTGVELVGLTTMHDEVVAQIFRTIVLSSIFENTSLRPRFEVAGRLHQLEDIHEAAEARSVGPYEDLVRTLLLTDALDASMLHYEAFVETGTADVAALAQAVGAASDAESVTTLGEGVAVALDREADSIIRAADAQRRGVVGLAATLVAAALIVTVVASRSITNPLRSLTSQAIDMASNRLPAAVQAVLDTPPGQNVVVPEVAPIVVRTRDEVANVTAALNSVQTSALDLAVEQAALRKNIADSFLNLGRRNQNLLDRQLESITALETEEQEPERLEELFQLDHLATRMRRNAESLLRLAGAPDSASAGWAAPAPIVDVVRSALSEVEHYQRVTVRGLEPVVVHPAAAADLAHVIAELVENALQFSPPAEPVRVRGRHTAEGYTLAVIDSGIGMSQEQLATANRRLAGAESFTVAPSRYLGHYVAGRLGSSLGIGIELEQQAAGGITARIDLPVALLWELVEPRG